MAPMGAGAELAAPLALDANALAALKQQAQASPRAALSAVAGQFEALFVQMLLKTMREALPQDGMLQSDTSKMYTSMFDQQIAQQMGKRGIGLKQMLERQLAPAMTQSDASAAAGAVHRSTGGSAGAVQKAGSAAPAAGSSGQPLASRTPSSRRTRVADGTPVANGTPAADGTPAGRAPAGGVAGTVPAKVRAFIETMRPHAEAAARVIGVPAELLLAQAGLETGWGKSQPKAADGSASHNLFGIKAGQHWNGAVAVASTTEYVAGAIVRTIDRFRSYGSYTEAFKDFGRMIAGNARYAGALAHADDPVAYARELQRGGYATDPHYADKLIRAIRLIAGQDDATRLAAADGQTDAIRVAAADGQGDAMRIATVDDHAGRGAGAATLAAAAPPGSGAWPSVADRQPGRAAQVMAGAAVNSSDLA